MPALPLAGRRVLVTRAAHQAGKLNDGLRALGAEPVEVPVLEIQPPVDFAPLDRALRSLDSYDWLILTSANTVRALADRAQTLGVRLATATSGLKVAAVGDATATAARNAGFAVALVPETYVAESLIDKLLRHGHEVSGHDRGTHPVGGSRATNLRKNCFGGARSVRARLQSCHKSREMNRGFSPRGRASPN
jgi:uroporphyrinogen-III synthase